MFDIPKQWLIDRWFREGPQRGDFSRSPLVVRQYGAVGIFDMQTPIDRPVMFTRLYPQSLEQLDCLIEMAFPPKEDT